jgi:hypothetical protein
MKTSKRPSRFKLRARHLLGALAGLAVTGAIAVGAYRLIGMRPREISPEACEALHRKSFDQDGNPRGMDCFESETWIQYQVTDNQDVWISLNLDPEEHRDRSRLASEFSVEVRVGLSAGRGEREAKRTLRIVEQGEPVFTLSRSDPRISEAIDGLYRELAVPEGSPQRLSESTTDHCFHPSDRKQWVTLLHGWTGLIQKGHLKTDAGYVEMEKGTGSLGPACAYID